MSAPMAGKSLSQSSNPPAASATAVTLEPFRPGRAPRGRLTGLFLLTLVCVMALIGLVYFAAQRQNDVALDNTRHVMASVVGALRSNLGRLVYDYTWWDAAIENLFPVPDPEWAEGNIGLYMTETHGVSWTVVVDEQDRVLYVSDQGEPRTIDFRAITNGGFPELVAQSRAGSMAEPGIASGFLMIDGTLNIAVVGTFTPEFPTEKQLERKDRPVLVFAKRLDRTLLDRIASDYRIDDLRLVPPDHAGTGAALPLFLVDGTLAGHLVSRPVLPGQSFINDTMPWLGLFAVMVVSISFFFLMRTRAAIADTVARQSQLSSANLALKSSEARVRDFAESASDWFWETDADLRVAFVSDRFTDITGQPASDIVGRRLLEFIADSRVNEDDGDPGALGEMFESRATIRNLPVRWSRADRRLYLQISATPVIGADGQFLGYRGTGTDITDRVLAEEALRRHRDDLEQRVAERTAELESANTERRDSENRYRQLVENSPDAIAVFQDGSCVFANGAGLRLFGVGTTDDVAGQRIGDLLPPLSDSDRETLERLAGAASSVPRSVSYFDKQNHTREADAMSAETLFSGATAILLVLRDVTESKVAQRQLAQAAKLATLGEMTAGMAHELRQPLNIIRMSADGSVMMIDQGDDDIEHYAEEFAVISGQCERMAEIIDHMQVFGRGEVGEPVAFNPSETVQYATAMLERQFRLDDIRIRLEAPAAVRSIYGFPVRLEQVMVNLLNNAREAILDNAAATQRVAVENRLITVSVRDEADDDCIEIVVEDVGGGIDQDVIGRIFDPFFTTKAVGSGTGLGLSIVYGIVTEMGGTIEATNVKRGTRFIIRFPVDARHAEAMELPGGTA